MLIFNKFILMQVISKETYLATHLILHIGTIPVLQRVLHIFCIYLVWRLYIFTSPPEGLRGIVFTRYVCLSVCVSGQYFGILFIGY